MFGWIAADVRAASTVTGPRTVLAWRLEGVDAGRRRWCLAALSHADAALERSCPNFPSDSPPSLQPWAAALERMSKTEACKSLKVLTLGIFMCGGQLLFMVFIFQWADFSGREPLQLVLCVVC